ncbi:MAG: glycosyltransferase family 61 protein [Chloroflexota bacterium]
MTDERPRPAREGGNRGKDRTPEERQRDAAARAAREQEKSGRLAAREREKAGKAERLAERERSQAARQERADRPQAPREPSRPESARSLDPGLFRLEGYDAPAAAEIRRMLAVPWLDSDDPETAVIADAILVPGLKLRGDDRDDDGPGFTGGVLDATGSPVELADLRRGRGKAVTSAAGLDAPEPAIRLEAGIYLGWFDPHFGRFLLETLSRAWAIDHLDAALPVFLHYSTTREKLLAAWQYDLLAALGVDQSRLLLIREPVRVGRLIVPEALFIQQRSGNPAFAAMFRRMAARLGADGAPAGQPLYLSRRLLGSHNRTAAGEQWLEDILTDNGFRIACPERMPIREQARLFASHREIVSAVGSAAHGVLFSPPGARLHLLAHGRFIPRNFPLVSALAEAPTTFLNAMDSGGRALTGGYQITPQRIDAGAVADYLDGAGLIRSRTRRALLRSLPGQDAEYAELWLHAAIREALAEESDLPAAIEREARETARTSWPVALLLTQYDALRRDPGADDAALRLCALVRAEPDLGRLMRYRTDLLGFAQWAAAEGGFGAEAASAIAALAAERLHPEDAVSLNPRQLRTWLVRSRT